MTNKIVQPSRGSGVLTFRMVIFRDWVTMVVRRYKNMQYSLRRLISIFTGIAIILGVGMMLTTTWRSQLAIREDLKTQGASWVGFQSSDAELLPSVVYHQPVVDTFRHYKRLGMVELKCYDLTPQCLERLSTLEHIDKLYLISCRISDDDLLHLPSVNVSNLLFWNTNVSDSDVDLLAKIHGVKKMTFKTTNVTPQGIEELQLALPGVEIVSLQ